MVEVSEELIEAMDRRQVLIAVTQVILAEMARSVPLALEDFG